MTCGLLVARGGVEPPTFRFSGVGGHPAGGVGCRAKDRRDPGPSSVGWLRLGALSGLPSARASHHRCPATPEALAVVRTIGLPGVGRG